MWSARLGVLLGSLLVLVLATACSSSSNTPSVGSSSGTATSGGSSAGSISVSLAEWTVKPSASSAKAGDVTFSATNKGTTPHELLIVQTDLAQDKLPQANGAVDETKVNVIGRTAALDVGKSESKTVTLKAGNYVLLCNLPAHYGQGMHTAFTVQ